MRTSPLDYLGITLLLLLPNIECTQDDCPKRGYTIVGDDINYEITSTEVTSKGIRFDSSGQKVSGNLIDKLTNEVEECLNQQIDRNSFIVKIPNNWTLSCDKTQQLLNSRAPEYGCWMKDKGTSDCPCRWRALVQCPNVIVTTPSFYLYKDALVRFITESNNPWGNPDLVPCIIPSTDPLSQ